MAFFGIYFFMVVFRSFPMIMALFTRSNNSSLTGAGSVSPSNSYRVRPFKCAILCESPIGSGDKARRIAFERSTPSFRFLTSGRYLINSSGFRFASTSKLSPFGECRVSSLAVVASNIPISRSNGFFLDMVFFPPVRIYYFMIMVIRSR